MWKKCEARVEKHIKTPLQVLPQSHSLRAPRLQDVQPLQAAPEEEEQRCWSRDGGMEAREIMANRGSRW